MRSWLIAGVLVVCGLQGYAGEPTLFTSTRYVMDAAFSSDGTLWVATRGGVLRRDAKGAWSKFTTANGLPSSEPAQIRITDGSVQVVFYARASAVWRDGEWTVGPAVPWRPSLPDRPAPPPPNIPGTHIVTRCRGGSREIAALFGDGLYEYAGGKWVRLEIGLPDNARDITALASDGSALWVGTRRDGLWRYDGKVWTQFLQPDEPYSHNVQCIAPYRGSVYFSTLEDGLAVRTGGKWQHVSAPAISSDAPRQMVEFGGSLYVRQTDGKVDRLDGDKWTLDVLSKILPRKQAYALACDGKRLYVGEWGGWSEFDGKTWTHHLKHSELQGIEVTAILPEERTVWVGTQGHGLAEVDRATEKVCLHDERNGLADDWVRCISRADGTLYVGTYVGGLLARRGSAWEHVPGVQGSEITDLKPDGAGGLLAATRSSAYRVASDGQVSQLDARVSEAQALCPCADGVWVGTRSGIWLLPK